MRRKLPAIFGMLLLAAQANAGEAGRIAAVANAVSAWDPIAIRVADSGIAIAFDRHPVAEDEYRRIIVDGVCLAYRDNPAILEGVAEVAILSRHDRGWVFDGGADGCDEINAGPKAKEVVPGWGDKLPREVSHERWLKIVVAGYTRMH